MNSPLRLQVRSTDSYKLRKKVDQVRVIVDKEMGFVRSPTAEDDYCLTTYLYVQQKRIIGLASAELIRKAYLLENNYNRSRTGRKAVIGIHQIWVHTKYRGRKIATRLVDTVRSKLVFNFVVPAYQIAFSSPTESGIAFAKKYVQKPASVPSLSSSASSKPSGVEVLVYECH